MLAQATRLLVEKGEIPSDVMAAAMDEIMRGPAAEPELAAFLTALRMKGETAQDLTSAVEVLRRHMIRLELGETHAVDTCGTGGDGQGTFNISTAAALVAAGAGAAIVKHGNRSASSPSGSADVLEALGVKVDVAPAVVEQAFRETGFAFCFAPRFHPAMRHAAAIRKRLGFRTIFNLMGPLGNPAGAACQLLGVGRREHLDLVAEVLARLGTGNAFVVWGRDGLDEVTLSGETEVRHVQSGGVVSLAWSPEDFGLARVPTAAFRVASARESADRVKRLLEGHGGPDLDIVLANAAAVLHVAGRAESLREGVSQARDAVARGAARGVLDRLATITREKGS